MLRFAMRKPLAGLRSAVEEFQSYQGPFELGFFDVALLSNPHGSPVGSLLVDARRPS
jgi:hypothetical protein